MFSALRNRLHVSPTTVIATLALVFAMTGGAYAAKKYLITSTKQISPSVLKSLQGKAGPAGANGAPGAPGAQGPAGPAGAAGAKGETGGAGTPGKDGAAGKEGPKGTTGKEGATGKEGKEGEEGSPWTVNGTLPSEATETGAWWFQGLGTEEEYEPISFPIPLSSAEAAQITVHFWKKGGEEDPECPGNVLEPKAKPGALCFYKNGRSNIGANPEAERPDFNEVGVGPSGTLLFFQGPLSASQQVGGSFAVTAP
jgi:hypothetical protein